MGLAPLGKFFVMNFDDLGSEFAVRRIKPETIDTQYLNVNSAFVERLQPLRPHDVWSAGPISRTRREICIFHDIPNFRHDAMSMHINDLDALATHRNFPALAIGRLRRLQSGLCETAAGNERARSCARNTFQEIPAIPHGFLPDADLCKAFPW